MIMLQDTKVARIPPSLALVIGGMMWGLYWIPVRFFYGLGLSGSWPGIVMYAAALAVLAPILWYQRKVLLPHWRVLVFSGVFTGAAFSLFSTSLVYTEVVRSILLFYLTPIWSTLLGLALLGERLSLARILSLVAGICGLFVVLGDGNGLPWPRNIGDWLALLSGITWAVGTLGLYRAQGSTIIGQLAAFIAGALLISVLSISVTWSDSLAAISQVNFAPVLPYVLLSVVYLLPMIFLTIWPATKLSPARVGLLLMSEVIVGIASAAAFAGEPFGWTETLGAALIVSAALIEVVWNK